MESSKSLVDKFEGSIRRLTKQLLTVSENTVMHVPELGKFKEFAWVDDDDLITAFRRNFDQLSANEIPNISAEDQRLVVKDLTERINFLKAEIEKMEDEKARLKDNISFLSQNESKIYASKGSFSFR